MSNKNYIIIVFIILLSSAFSFYSGFFVKSQLNKNPQSDQKKTSQLFRPNFIDEAIFVSKDTPKKVLIISAIRTYSEPDNNYTVKAFYYDGKEWHKEISEGNSKSLEFIPKNNLITKWYIQNDPSYMLKQSISGEVKINNETIEFSIPLILNEIPIRSNYKYTKFMSVTNGEMKINKGSFLSNVVYSRIYSFNPPEGLIFTSNPAGIETEWLAFWDNENNFYSIDESKINDKVTNNTYKAHSMAIIKDNQNRTWQSFVLNLKKNNNGYKVDVENNNVNKTIYITKVNSVNKSINNKDRWVTGIAEGFIQDGAKKVSGLGIYEEISQ